MPRYIDRELAISMPWANGKYDKENANEHFICGLETYKEWLENLPTTEVVEVKHGEMNSTLLNKVIDGLEHCIKDKCDGCPYKFDDIEVRCMENLMTDSLYLHTKYKTSF